jgi:hypothetical protein
MTGTAAAEAKRTVVTGDAQTLDKVVAFFCHRFNLPPFEVKTLPDVAERLEVELAKIPPSESDAPASAEIIAVCNDLAKMLLQKNKAYGNSALEPLRIFSKADAAEQIKVRMDDKMSRLMRGEAAGEDALADFVGYWVLLQVLKRRAKTGNGHEG